LGRRPFACRPGGAAGEAVSNLQPRGYAPRTGAYFSYARKVGQRAPEPMVLDSFIYYGGVYFFALRPDRLISHPRFLGRQWFVPRLFGLVHPIWIDLISRSISHLPVLPAFFSCGLSVRVSCLAETGIGVDSSDLRLLFNRCWQYRLVDGQKFCGALQHGPVGRAAI